MTFCKNALEVLGVLACLCNAKRFQPLSLASRLPRAQTFLEFLDCGSQDKRPSGSIHFSPFGCSSSPGVGQQSVGDIEAISHLDLEHSRWFQF